VPDRRPGADPETGALDDSPGNKTLDASPETASPASGDGLAPGGLAAVDTIAENFQARHGQPGLAYGVVAGGSLVHARGLGERWLGGPAPDAGTVFRIASMTKSFTAAAVLALRDDGALALDDPAEEYVPELRGMRLATADSPLISIRHLLTMTAGFPTDDPWGDRQQGTPAEEFSEFLSGGVSFAWAPGTRFEYSNLGYAILGRVVAAAAGSGYPEFVRDRLLRPLGLSRTGFEAADFPTAQLARGYSRDGAGWAELVSDPYGAFAPMGGVFSCLHDLARWVGGFAAAFPRARMPPAGRIRWAARPGVRCSCRRWGRCSAGRRGSWGTAAQPITASGFSSRRTASMAGSSSTAAATPALAVTCAGTRGPGSA